MLTKPIFKPTFHVEVIEPEGVFLLSEQGHFVLKGELFCVIAPLLDGRRTADEIVDALADQASMAEVYYALSLMEARGYTVEASAEIPSERAAYWHATSVDPALAEQRLRATPVALLVLPALQSLALGPFAGAFTAMGLQLAEYGEFTIVLTDDYLQEGLAEINAAALASGKPWIIVKPVGTQLWIGPVFRPGVTACWECLALRLRANRDVESYLLGRTQRLAPFPVSRAAMPAGLQAAAQLAALEAAKAIGRGFPGVSPFPPSPAFPPLRTIERTIEKRAGERGQGEAGIVTLDTLTLETRRHTVARLPRCPGCGDPSPFEPLPLALERCPKPLLAAGSHRTLSAEQILAQYQRHVSPLTGAVSSLDHIPYPGQQPPPRLERRFSLQTPARHARSAALGAPRRWRRQGGIGRGSAGQRPL